MTGAELMAQMAKAEARGPGINKTPSLPPSPSNQMAHKLTVESVKQMILDGCTYQQIADNHGVTRAAVNSFIYRHKLSGTHLIGSNT